MRTPTPAKDTGPNPTHGLTAKQITFAHYVADGLTQSEAYRRVYGWNPNNASTRREAFSVRHNPKVAAFIEELRKEIASIKLVDRVTKRRVLTAIINDRSAPLADRLKAIQIDNLMCGDNKAVKVEGEITIASILREIAPNAGLPSQDKFPKR